MSAFVVASHNLFFRLNADRMLADLRKGDHAAVRVFQEAGGTKQRRVLRRHAEEVRRLVVHPKGSPLATDLDPEVFALERSELHKLHEGHPTARVLGFKARYALEVDLTHRETGKRVLVFNVHATNGGLQPEHRTRWRQALDDWKNDAVRWYWLGMVGLLVERMASDEYDLIVVAGDFNARLTNRDRWYYPGVQLDGLTTMDPAKPKSIDHIVYTLGTDARMTHRDAVQIMSDHRLHTARFVL